MTGYSQPRLASSEWPGPAVWSTHVGGIEICGLLDCISLGNFPVWKLGGVGLLHEKSPTNKDLKWLKGVVASGPSWRTSLVGNSLSWFYFGLEFGQMRGHIAGLVMIWGLVSVLDRI